MLSLITTCKKRDSRPGFTLAELVVVISICSLTVAVAAPRWVTSLQNYRLSNAGNRIITDLNRAQSAAYNRSSSITVTFVPSTSKYTLAGIVDLDHKSQSNCTVDLTQAPYQCQIVSANFAGAQSVTFSGFGLPNSAGTIVVSLGGSSKTITVDATTGKAVMQ